MQRRHLSVLVSLGLLLSSCSAAKTSSPDKTSASLEWKLCGDVECTTVEVPMNYNKPGSGSFLLKVSRHKAKTGMKSRGVLMLNPGGPGLPGASMVSNSPLYLSAEVINQFDVVSWDPRGTGESTPTFSCPISPALGLTDPVAAQQKQKTSVVSCMNSNSQIIAHMGTANTARDINKIRSALGVKTISFLGYSYGGLLGAVWASMFPTTVRAMVLDSPPSINSTPLEAKYQFAKSTQTLWNKFRKQYSVKVAKIPNVLLARAVVASITNRDAWPRLNEAIRSANNNDLSQLKKIWDEYLYLDTESEKLVNSVAARYATLCADTISTKITSPQETDQLISEFPMTGAIIGNDFLCQLWPDVASTMKISAVTSPVLVVGATQDPVTPFTEAQDLSRRLVGSHLLEVESWDHTNYLTNKCVTEQVNLLLLSLSVPSKNLICR